MASPEGNSHTPDLADQLVEAAAVQVPVIDADQLALFLSSGPSAEDVAALESVMVPPEIGQDYSGPGHK